MNKSNHLIQRCSQRGFSVISLETMIDHGDLIEQKGSSAAYVLSPLLAEKLRKEADLDSRKVQMLKASARKKRRRELNIRPVDPVALKAIYDESANIRRMEKLVKRRKKSIKAGHLVVGFKKATSECTGITVTSTYKKIKGISRIY